MTFLEPRLRPREGVPRRRRAAIVWGVRLALVGAAFAVGVALGEALHDSPRPGGAQTSVRTLRPLPLPPARETVTVTVTTP